MGRRSFPTHESNTVSTAGRASDMTFPRPVFAYEYLTAREDILADNVLDKKDFRRDFLQRPCFPFPLRFNALLSSRCYPFLSPYRNKPFSYNENAWLTMADETSVRGLSSLLFVPFDNYSLSHV